MKTIDKTTIKQKLLELIESELGFPPEQVSDDTSFVGEMGADSLDLVEFAMKVEDEFGIDVKDEDLSQSLTLGKLVETIATKLENK